MSAMAAGPADIPAIVIKGLTKSYADGFQALKGIDLTINRGEIFALLGPNGAGKTTLIGIVCGIVRASSGQVLADGLDIQTQYKLTRSRIGLVPQELTTESFESVMNSVSFSRGLFGKPPNPALIEQILRDLSLWDKRAHEPSILFLDEPTAGVDVELRRDMWALVRKLRDQGVTIILTTHYIEEAEEMADRIGVINDGELVLVQDKASLMRQLGQKELSLTLPVALTALPQSLAKYNLVLSPEGHTLTYRFEAGSDQGQIAELLRNLSDCGIEFRDLQTRESSLEDIFVSLVRPTA